MSNSPYANFVLENKYESILTTKVDMANYLTADYSLSENAGMKKTIHKYKATGSVEDLAQGVGNSGVFEASYASEDYTVGVTQGKGQWYDEEAMKDPMIVDAIMKGMAEAMVNDFTSKAIAEMIKTQQTIECDFTTSSSGYLFGKIVDAAAKFGEESEGIFLLISPANLAYARKQLEDSLKYSEGFVRTGYVGTICGFPCIVSKAVPDTCAILASREAVTLFIKKATEVEQDRDPDLRKNLMYIRKVAVVALTNEKKAVILAKAQSTACTITTYTKNTKTVSGTCDSHATHVDVYVNSTYAATVTASSGSWTGTNVLSTNLAANDKVDAIAYAPGYAQKAATQVTVAS